ncbi:MAG: MBL fold metallo-hydrolase [Candidatus Hydrogenedentes bacterium]|nr:MBL fold metallo-hydrolase [Candidatus Hydrogenedentota bacterium]
MEIHSFQVTPFFENCFVVCDGGEALVIDPGDVSPKMLRLLAGCTVRAIVNTHCHCDHCGGNAELKAKTGADLLIHRDELPLLRSMEVQAQMFGIQVASSPDPDRFMNEGDVLTVGAASFKVLLAPGHSPGHVVLVGEGVAFVGDVLFAGSIGRTDLPGGDYRQLLDSIHTKLMGLPDETVVYSGHGPETTIGVERRSNPFLVGL